MPDAAEQKVEEKAENSNSNPHAGTNGVVNGAPDAGAGPAAAPHPSKRALKRQRKKEVKRTLRAVDAEREEAAAAFAEERAHDAEHKESLPATAPPPPLEVVPAPPDVDFSNPAFAELKRVYLKFITPREPPPEPSTPDPFTSSSLSAPALHFPSAAEPDEPSAAASILSRRKLKEQSRLSIAQLKQVAPQPSVVELHDVNSPDPQLLVHLKSSSNSVAVPAHWQAKKKYLSGKRGFEKLPFQLPDFIVQTGISKMRGVQLEKEAEKKSKAKQRDKMRPKMGAIDIDYQILHDAFFRYQTKPPLTARGALYYEGKEFEVKLTEKKPLMFSQALLDALGMPSAAFPPPWLYAMQRYGPPPSYPFLRVPGVNAPLPAGGRWGMGEGEWGKPPIDELGRPRWGGDLFGAPQEERKEHRMEGRHWGEIVIDDEQAEEEEEEEEEKAPAAQPDSPSLPPSAHPDQSGIDSVHLPGLQTPAALNLRKTDGRGTETPNTVHPQRRDLFTVLPETSVARGSGLLGVTHTYIIPNVDDGAGKKSSGVEVALDVSELEGLSGDLLKRKYEEEKEREEAELRDSGIGKSADEVIAQQKKKRKTKDKDKEETTKFRF